ncbi:PTS sugar transporter subunit IIA [Clostridium boliviensis]|uniref:PTS sugar transporter subunit IIA n=1 Tax=Clostridium boliviensis TaxID=318465 RepID=A0ABU4GK06_9CLOT|nr:PTS sugar transporter subunit IIA [Clostridium boliviensis]MDW2797939.1 PTS sugar transporter subunit IIA [Clostridium boliviensis]
MKLFVSSHGHLASGFQSSMEILYGRCDNLTVFDAYVDERSIKEQLEQFFKTVKDGEQVLLISDLYGSSVNQAMSLFLDRPDTILIAGANLALLIGLAGRERISREELEELIAQSREMLCIVDLEKETISDEEDFF